jgi:hypothetical protein
MFKINEEDNREILVGDLVECIGVGLPDNLGLGIVLRENKDSLYNILSYHVYWSQRKESFSIHKWNIGLVKKCSK